MTKNPPIIECLVVICSRGQGGNVTNILSSLRIDTQLISLGKGTADKQMAEYFDLNSDEKEIVFALIKLKHAKKIVDVIQEKMRFGKENKGLCFTLPLKSATSSTIERLNF